MLPKRLLMLFALITVLGSVASAQTEYEKWLKKQKEEFKDFKDKEDQAFLEFLEKDWKAFKESQALVRDVKPKPPVLPKASPASEASEIKKGPPVEVRPVPEPPKETPEVEKPGRPDEAIAVSAKSTTTATAIFFGSELEFRYDPALKFKLRKIDKDAIAEGFATLARAEYDDLLQQAAGIREKSSLNDWGYCRLLFSIACTVQGQPGDEAIMTTWFLLLKTGYLARIAYTKEEILLLLPSKNKIFGVSYLSLGEKKTRFYAFDFVPKESAKRDELYTYEQDYPGAIKVLDFSIISAPVFPTKKEIRSFTYTSFGKERTVQAYVDPGSVDFFKDYPQVEYPIYFASSMSAESRTSLVNALRAQVEGKTQTEAVNLILHFVQTAFAYKTDDEQFGKEKPLFPDETLYYPASDCEDRAVLFAHLIRDLLGLDVVGLDYPGHVATAVALTVAVEGDKFEHKGKTFVVCDPTYINATLGMTMPELKQSSPTVIEIF